MRTKTICIIDDDTIYQILIKKIIASAQTDYNVVSFCNAKDALERFKDDHAMPDIIMVDIEMPIMDGWTFMEEIDALLTNGVTPIPSIYIVSSSISPEDIEKSKMFPKITGYFSKPITTATIVAITHTQGIS
jgi:CheY-like chemotaxis protein